MKVGGKWAEKEAVERETEGKGKERVKGHGKGKAERKLWE